MNRHVNAIARRLSLRPPQRRSPETPDRIAGPSTKGGLRIDGGTMDPDRWGCGT